GRPRKPSGDLLDIDADAPAARQTDAPGGFIRDAEFEKLRLAALDHVHRLCHDRPFDAAARGRSEEIALPVDHEMAAHGPRGRAPSLHDGRNSHVAALLAPGF